MSWMVKRGLVLLIASLAVIQLSAQQFAYGATVKLEPYTRYANASDDIASRSAGSVLLNIGAGPKLWFGGDQFSASAEASFLFSPFAFSLGNPKGLGALSFPLMAKLEFFGLSNFNEYMGWGFAIGVGVEYSKTELWYLKPVFKEQGVDRPWYHTTVLELDVGYGASGFDIYGFARYGWSGATDANGLHIGIGFDFNIQRLIEEMDPEF